MVACWMGRDQQINIELPDLRTYVPQKGGSAILRY